MLLTACTPLIEEITPLLSPNVRLCSCSTAFQFTTLFRSSFWSSLLCFDTSSVLWSVSSLIGGSGLLPFLLLDFTFEYLFKSRCLAEALRCKRKVKQIREQSADNVAFPQTWPPKLNSSRTTIKAYNYEDWGTSCQNNILDTVFLVNNIFQKTMWSNIILCLF